MEKLRSLLKFHIRRGSKLFLDIELAAVLIF